MQIYDGAVCISHCITEVKRILMKENWIFRMLLKVKKKKMGNIHVSPVQNLLELLQVIILLHWVSSVNSTDSYLVTLPVPVHYLSHSPWHFERKLIRLCEVKSETRSIRIFMNPSKNLLGFLFLAILDLTSGEGQFLASFLWMKKVFIRHSNSRCWMSLLNQW